MKTIEIGRFNETLKKVVLEDSENMQRALEKANITLGEGENIQDLCGVTMQNTCIPENGKEYFIVQNFKQGK